jgi:peptidoglycan/LPS O-acetylase OafA/YrhL
LYIWHVLFLSGYMGAAFTGRALYDWRIWWIPALVLAMCSYYFFERPIASWRRRFRAPALQADRPPDDGVNSVTRPEPA